MAASIHRVRATAGTALFESAAAPLGDYASIAIGTNCMATIGCHDAPTGSPKVVQCRARSRDGVFRDEFE